MISFLQPLRSFDLHTNIRVFWYSKSVVFVFKFFNLKNIPPKGLTSSYSRERKVNTPSNKYFGNRINLGGAKPTYSKHPASLTSKEYVKEV